MESNRESLPADIGHEDVNAVKNAIEDDGFLYKSTSVIERLTGIPSEHVERILNVSQDFARKSVLVDEEGNHLYVRADCPKTIRECVVLARHILKDEILW
jgi:hypothetical protein